MLLFLWGREAGVRSVCGGGGGGATLHALVLVEQAGVRGVQVRVELCKEVLNYGIAHCIIWLEPIVLWGVCSGQVTVQGDI